MDTPLTEEVNQKLNLNHSQYLQHQYQIQTDKQHRQH